jgi:large subunit ribosomal protein L24
MVTIKTRKQRKMLFNRPQHQKRKAISAHLVEELLLKYDKRSLPVIKGDTVKVMRGSYKGHEDKIAQVDVKKRALEIEGITMTKADGNKIAKPIHPSNVIITKLNLTDKWRRKKFERGLSEDVKKEIEKEAEEQIKEAEEQRKLKEKEEKELAEKEEAEEKIEEEEKEVEKPKEEKTPEKTKEEKEVEKPKEEKEKPKPKKETTKKEVQKKTTSTKKPTEKKQSINKKSSGEKKEKKVEK